MRNVNDILENKEVRNELLGKIDVLEKVKDLLLLGNTDFATTQQVADYFEVPLETIKKIVQRHRDELESNGIKILSGSEIKDILVKDNLSITNKKGYFESEGQKFANRSNYLFCKRTILNVGMLLTESPIAEELRRRLLDVVHDVQEETPSIINNVVDEIRTEQQIREDMLTALTTGDHNRLMVLQTELLGLSKKRIVELENTIDTITTNKLTISESKKVINRLIRKIASKVYNGNFVNAYGELYSKINYKLDINIKSRAKKKSESYLSTLSFEEIAETEQIVRVWANEVGLDVERELKIG